MHIGWLTALVLLLVAPIDPAAAATECSGGWCTAPSVDFPDAEGGFGVVSGTNPQEPIYDYVGGAWVNLPGHVLAPGTPVYVSPSANGWRWVYTEHLAWCIIDANHLSLRWPSG